MEPWEQCIEQSTTDPLAWRTLKALLRLMVEAYRAGGRFPQPKDSLTRLQLWGLEVATELRLPPKGSLDVFVDRDHAIVLTLTRLKKPGTPVTTSNLVSTETSACGLVGQRLGKKYDAIRRVWKNNRQKVKRPDAELRWQRIEGLVGATAGVVVSSMKLGKSFGVRPANLLDVIHVGLYGRSRTP